MEAYNMQRAWQQMERKQYLSLTVLSLLASIAWGETLNSPSTVDTKFALPSLSGEYVKVSDFCYSGAETPDNPRSAVVLNFMSTTCKPCLRELPLFLKTVEGLKHKNVRTFLVSLDPLSKRDDLERVIAQAGITGTESAVKVLLDPYRTVATKLGVDTIPRVFVVSPEAAVVGDWSGFNGNLEKELGAAINKAVSPQAAVVSVPDPVRVAPTAALPQPETVSRGVPVTYVAFITVGENASGEKLQFKDIIPDNLKATSITYSSGGKFDRESRTLSIDGLEPGNVVFVKIEGKLKPTD